MIFLFSSFYSLNVLPLFLPVTAVEVYHKNYYEKHQDAPYCNFVIDPKIHKLPQQYGSDVKRILLAVK
jgi:hypothetical protein